MHKINVLFGAVATVLFIEVSLLQRVLVRGFRCS